MSTENPFAQAIGRREFLDWGRQGLSATALAALLCRDGVVHANEAALESLHFPPKVRRVIHLFLCGGMSHLDSFDYKPALERYHGKPLPGSEKPETFFGQIGLLRKNDFEFRQRGESGLWVSDLFPHLANVADELTVIRSMVADSANHTPATFQANTGFRFNGFPVLGSWLSYGMGCETDNLPTYVVLPDSRGLPAGSTINWSNGFLPARHQGVAFRPTGDPLDDLFPSGRPFDNTQESRTRDFIASLNERHLESHPESDLAARITAYQLAARMQFAIPEVANLAAETAAMQEAYGLNREETQDFGRSCLLGRRLLEGGVRFVQIFSGGSFGSPRINWDGHEDVRANHSQEALRVDQPIAALIRDLRQRGMLDDTLVLMTTEFGRTPFTQSQANTVGTGRDHNMYGFSVCMAGGGLRHGFAYGNTDDIGWKSVDKPVYWHDFHATVLRLLGIDHERLTYYHNGIERRLTNVHGHVIDDVLDT